MFIFKFFYYTQIYKFSKKKKKFSLYVIKKYLNSNELLDNQKLYI